MTGNFLERLEHDLNAPIQVRGFGSGWFSGFFGLLFAISGFAMVVALRYPEWFAMPELQVVKDWPGFRGAVHLILLAGYGLALLSLLLRPRKVLGATALVIALAASLLGGSNVQPSDTASWGVFFGLDFFIVNLLVTGFMFAPIERLWPHRAEQRLFRTEWREDLFYFLVSTMMVQLFAFLALAPQAYVNANTSSWDQFRHWVSSLPWIVQFVAVVILSDLFQYWYHRLFHQVPFLWGFHAVHHSARSMDWLAGARMHFVEVVLLRAVTSLPLFTLGFSPTVMQAYIGFVYVYSSLLHANLRGDFDRLGHWLATPRFHHWHHAMQPIDKNFAVHFPWIDRLFGTYHMPRGEWPPETGIEGDPVPPEFSRQLIWPFWRQSR